MMAARGSFIRWPRGRTSLSGEGVIPFGTGTLIDRPRVGPASSPCRKTGQSGPTAPFGSQWQVGVLRGRVGDEFPTSVEICFQRLATFCHPGACNRI